MVSRVVVGERPKLDLPTTYLVELSFPVACLGALINIYNLCNAIWESRLLTRKFLFCGEVGPRVAAAKNLPTPKVGSRAFQISGLLGWLIVHEGPLSGPQGLQESFDLKE